MAAVDTTTVTIGNVALRGAFGSGVPDLISSTTTNYFQRVYDDGTGGYCYYTKTTIDPTPSAGETTPNYTGTISGHSVVKVITTP
jgi:hypothetical protein